MRFSETDLPGVIVVEPDVHREARGFFLETYEAVRYAEGGIGARFVQDNHSRSARGTLRGLHLQIERPQGKLCRAIAGEVYDVAVDVRRGSPTFGRHFGTSPPHSPSTTWTFVRGRSEAGRAARSATLAVRSRTTRSS